MPASVGVGFFARSAAVVIIMPAWQSPHCGTWSASQACCSGMLSVARKSFDGGDAASSDGGNARGAGARGFAIHVDGTGAAERLTAAELCAG
jgi:hypothetical protein